MQISKKRGIRYNQPMDIKQIIGDYESFFVDILTQLDTLRIDIQGMPISHLCYRVATFSEYETIRDQLKQFCAQYNEDNFNGRLISLLVLKTSLTLFKGVTTSMIELPSPRKAHAYPTGLEHVGIVVGKKLPEFKEKYKNVLTGEKDRGYYSLPFIEFPNGKIAKFYDYPLKEIVEREGKKFSPSY